MIIQIRRYWRTKKDGNQIQSGIETRISLLGIPIYIKFNCREHLSV